MLMCFRLMELEMAVQELCQSRNQVARLESEMNQLVEDPTSMAFRCVACNSDSSICTSSPTQIETIQVLLSTIIYCTYMN